MNNIDDKDAIELAKILIQALNDVGNKDENGDVLLWKAIENENFKIMVTNKNVYQGYGFTDAKVEFVIDKMEGEDNE